MANKRADRQAALWRKVCRCRLFFEVCTTSAAPVAKNLRTDDSTEKEESQTRIAKFTNFKVDYHDQTLEDVVSRHANPPLELPADYSAVSEAIDQAIGR